MASVGYQSRGGGGECARWGKQRNRRKAVSTSQHLKHQPTTESARGPLRRGLMLRRHPAAHRHPRVLPARLLLLLQVLVVGGHLLLLLVGHVSRVHAARTWTRHALLLRVDVVVADVLGRLGGHVGRVDAVLVARGLGRIEACLRRTVSACRVGEAGPGADDIPG